MSERRRLEPRHSSPDGKAEPELKFTAAERRVLGLLCTGATNKQIATRLHRSEFTVKTHVQRMIAKAGVRNRVGLVTVALLQRDKD
jgi:DNA-binding NarL/FixJ family response regulator